MKKLKVVKNPGKSDVLVFLLNPNSKLNSEYFGKSEQNLLKKAIESQSELVLYSKDRKIYVSVLNENSDWNSVEQWRRKGASMLNSLCSSKDESFCLIHSPGEMETSAFLEGAILANYRFNKYKKSPDSIGLKSLSVHSEVIAKAKVDTINAIAGAVTFARDLVNEPFNQLNSVQLAEEYIRSGKSSGYKVDVWNEARITAQKMGGILAVNRASKVPPTFSILEYKPEKPINKKPIVFVGKGVVYDTGGLSLKPTPNSMDHMKCDMAGAAAVGGILQGVAEMKLPLHVIGLVPATDNWIGENSYAPGDVITMYDGTTVEILNTDAEGRLILADALHFAKKLKPELVVDFATLTGAAVRAIGPYASAFFSSAEEDVKSKVFDSSYRVFERLVEFPLWQEYADELKSEIADMTNLGKGEGGQISAAKFLQHFTDYPWMHIDIAGPAFADKASHYTTHGGTGVGVRLMLDFLVNLIPQNKKK